MRWSKLLHTSALVLAGGMSLGGALYAVEWIEGRSLAAVAQALSDNRLSWARVGVDGLRVTLSGTAPDEQTRFRALTVAGTVVEGSRVVDRIEVQPAEPLEPPTYRVEILRSDGGISLIGLVPEGQDRDALRDTIRDLAKTANVTDLLETASDPAEENWSAALAFGLDALTALPRAKISITADRVGVTAVTDSQEEKRRIERDLSQSVPAGVALALDISAPRPVFTPFTVRFLIDDTGARFDACAADTPEAKAEILRAALDAGLEETFDCPLGLGVPTPEWGAAVAAGIDALAAIGGGNLTFADADVTLIAREGTDPALFDAEAGALESALPEVFALHASLPADPADEEEADLEGPVRFVAERGPEGVRMQGPLPDERAREVVEGFAQAHFGSTGTELAARLDADAAPEGWVLRVLAGLDALGHLASGSLTVTPDRLEVSGDTGNEDAEGAITRLLAEQLGEGADFSIDVAYREELDPATGVPTPQECVTRIEAAMAERKITFDPGSSQVDAESRPTIDRIAEILRECGPIPLQIAGFTDSQGREEMNRELSQARADAVLDELMSRRVLTSGLTAVGYGEEQPIADNATAEGREANRRIEFRLPPEPEEAEEDGAADEDAAAEDADGQE
ncbi:OmpA family protein [Roseitranquillus sediminis]|uniref:OmpA family protein n=1 Tax=Roseitranquillus sediminis TaxID=2809051 RepID=UPI001D0C562A|nr:OmpA family protein [Roseitranquillus sediminis]MBM9593351.1 OmpA family protein [Roseitranquillus sediminis]